MRESILDLHMNNCNSLPKGFVHKQLPAMMRPRDFPQLTFDEARNHQLTHLSAENRALYDNDYLEDRFAPKCMIGTLRDNITGEVRSTLACNMWSCPVCAAKKKNKLIKEVNKAFADQDCFFMTLTVKPNDDRFSDKDITKAFARLRASLYKYGFFDRSQGHIYTWVKEFTPPSHEYVDDLGRLRMSVGNVRHLHILTNFMVPNTIRYTTPTGIGKTRTRQSLWQLATRGTSHVFDIVVETKAHGKVRSSYMTKYITKGCDGETSEHGFQKYERRFGKSVGLFQMRPPSQHTCFLQFLSDKTVWHAKEENHRVPRDPSGSAYLNKLGAVKMHG